MDGLDALLSRVPVRAAVRDALRDMLLDRGRHYHGAEHVVLLWKRHLRFRAGLTAPAEPWDTLIACAIAFHDAVYDPRRCDNEAASAAFWRSAGATVSATGSRWVAATIEATADHLGARPEPGMSAQAWQARLWMLDLDLTPIGEPAEEFVANTTRLRREYAHLEDATWEEARLAFLRRIEAAPRIFRSTVLAAAFENAARCNIARELALSRAPRLPARPATG